MYTLSQHIEEKAIMKRETKFIMNMHQKGYTLEQIADVSEKTVKEIESILKDKEFLPA